MAVPLFLNPEVRARRCEHVADHGRGSLGWGSGHRVMSPSQTVRGPSKNHAVAILIPGPTRTDLAGQWSRSVSGRTQLWWTQLHARGPSADCVESNQFRRPRASPHPTRHHRSEARSPVKSEDPV